MKNTLKFDVNRNNGLNINELISLTKTYYSEGDVIDRDYLQWQYHKNPSGKPYLFTSREQVSQELAGQYLVIPIKFNVLNKERLGTLSLNTLTSPKYQGKGLFTRMAKVTYESCYKNNALLTIGFPNPNSYPGFVRKLDFTHLGDIPLLIKPLRYFNLVISFLKKNRKKHGGDIILKKIERNNIKEFDFNKDLDKYNKFWNKIKEQYTISTNKNYEFINWRYNTIPTRKYNIFYIEEDNNIKGVIFFKSAHVWGFKVGIIMDLLVDAKDKKVGKHLIKYVRKLSIKNKLDFITCLHSEKNESRILKNNGFYNLPQKLLPQKIHFIVRINKKFNESDKLLNLKNWKLTFGDYDVF